MVTAGHDYANAIMVGIHKFLKSNEIEILNLIDKSIQAELVLVLDRAVDLSAAAIMTKLGQFLDNNRDEFIAATAAAMASAWKTRQDQLERSATVIRGSETDDIST